MHLVHYVFTKSLRYYKGLAFLPSSHSSMQKSIIIKIYVRRHLLLISYIQYNSTESVLILSINQCCSAEWQVNYSIFNIFILFIVIIIGSINIGDTYKGYRVMFTTISMYVWQQLKMAYPYS